jgi:hypothetical protein
MKHPRCLSFLFTLRVTNLPLPKMFYSDVKAQAKNTEQEQTLWLNLATEIFTTFQNFIWLNLTEIF